MRPRLAMTLLIVALAIPKACAAEFDFFQPLMPPRPFQVMARAGAADRAPVNTKPAIQLAIVDGFEWVAVRIARTKDGQHVLADESPLLGTAAGESALGTHTLSELQALDAGSWFAPRFARVKWLSLAECLELAKGKVNLLLQLVDVDPLTVAREVQSAGMERQVLVMADRKLLDPLREIAGQRLAMAEQLSSADPRSLAGAKPAAVEIEATLVTSDACRSFHEQGVRVIARFSGAHDAPAWWQKAVAAGADFLDSSKCEEIIANTVAQRFPSRTCRLACHRGASRYAPENTIVAFAKAIALHADFVEFDVRPSRDGVYFLLHDAKLDRTTDGRGPIRELSSEAIAKLDAGRWFGHEYATTRVPTLEEFLSWVPPGLELYFDAKDIKPEDLARSLAEHDLTARTVVYQSAEYLHKLAQVDSRIRGMPPARSEADIDKLLATPPFKPYAVDSPWRALSRQYIKHCHAVGVRVFSDAPGGTTADAMRQAIEWGLDLIQTDEPTRYWRAVELAGAATGRADGSRPSAGK